MLLPLLLNNLLGIPTIDAPLTRLTHVVLTSTGLTHVALSDSRTVAVMQLVTPSGSGGDFSEDFSEDFDVGSITPGSTVALSGRTAAVIA